MRYKLAALLIGVCLVLALGTLPLMTACAPEEEEEVKILRYGAVLPLTGMGAAWGMAFHQGMEMAIDEANEAGFVINGQRYKIEFHSFDDRSDPKLSVTGAIKMVELGCPVMNYAWTAPLAIQNITEPAKVVVMGTGGPEEQIRPGVNYFTAWESPDCILPFFGEWLDTLNVKKVALISENSPSCIDRHSKYISEWETKGIKVVFDEIAEMDASDYSTVIAKIREADPDVVWLNGWALNMLLVAQQRLELDYPVQLIGQGQISNGGIPAFRMLGKAGEGTLDTMFALPRELATEDIEPWVFEALGCDPKLREHFNKVAPEKYGMEYHTSVRLVGYDVTTYTLKMIAHAGSLDPDAIMAALEEMIPYKGAGINLSYWPNHRFILPQLIVRYHNIDSETGTCDVEFLGCGRALSQDGKEWDIHFHKKMDVQEIREGKDPLSGSAYGVGY